MNYYQRDHLAARGSACLKNVIAMPVMLPRNTMLLVMLLVLETLPWA
ncbi:hypothetical protein [Pseudomonas sp. NPDC087804]|jgi:hypothetical protein